MGLELLSLDAYSLGGVKPGLNVVVRMVVWVVCSPLGQFDVQPRSRGL